MTGKPITLIYPLVIATYVFFDSNSECLLKLNGFSLIFNAASIKLNGLINGPIVYYQLVFYHEIFDVDQKCITQTAASYLI